MLIKTARYIHSVVDVAKCPAGDMPEIAFIGRSNVGKSSLINMLAGIHGLAKTSARPGKTQTINYFLVNEQWHLVDLPGYGYAKVSRVQREKWDEMIRNYLLHREQMRIVFQLVDGTIGPQKLDLDFSNWLGENAIPFALVFTKTDRRKKAVPNPVEAYLTEMRAFWETLPPYYVTSAQTSLGKQELLAYIGSIVGH